MAKKIQQAHVPTHLHGGIDLEELESKYSDLLAPIEELEKERANVWSRWVWVTGSERDYNRAAELDEIINKKQHLSSLFEQMLKPVGK